MEEFYMKVSSLNEELKKEDEEIKSITDSVFYQRKQVSIDFGEEIDGIMMAVLGIAQTWLEDFGKEHIKPEVHERIIKQMMVEKASEFGSLSYHIGNVLEVINDGLVIDKMYLSEIKSRAEKVQSILEEFVK